jgi:hypothetical protein
MAGQNLIIDVALRLGSYVDHAEVSADFATGEFYVMSPLVSLTIVYPAIVVGSDAAVEGHDGIGGSGWLKSTSECQYTTLAEREQCVVNVAAALG